mgnify:FL=1
MMKYKAKINTHSDNIENGLTRLFDDITSNRLNKVEILNTLKNLIVKAEYLQNLINLED